MGQEKITRSDPSPTAREQRHLSLKVNLGGISLFSRYFSYKRSIHRCHYRPRSDASRWLTRHYVPRRNGRTGCDMSGVKLLRVLQNRRTNLSETVPCTWISVWSALPMPISNQMVRRPQLPSKISFTESTLIGCPSAGPQRKAKISHCWYDISSEQQCEHNGLSKVDFSSDALEYLSRLPYPRQYT